MSSSGVGGNPHHLSSSGGHLSGPLSSGGSSVSSSITGNSAEQGGGGGGGGGRGKGAGSQGGSQPKKPRLVFTDLQRRTLQAIFKETKRPSKEMQITISQQLGLELSTVGNFFMNARRRSQDKWMEDVPSSQGGGGHHHRQDNDGSGGGGGGGGGSGASASSSVSSSKGGGSKKTSNVTTPSSNAMPVLTMGSNVIVSCT